MCRSLPFLFLLILFGGCQRSPHLIEPSILCPPHPKEIDREKRGCIGLPKPFSASPFPPLILEEYSSDWGKEYRLGRQFAEDFDLYRAITDFKRALCLLPAESFERRLEVSYCIALAYFLGRKYQEAAFTVESTELASADASFPAFSDLLLLLYESYKKMDKQEKAEHIFSLIQCHEPEKAGKLVLLSRVETGDIQVLAHEAETNPSRAYLAGIVRGYCNSAKSVRKAEIYNALLPGAGYWYVGQKQTAVTALLINSLFIGAASHFICSGNAAAALITLSFEGGWYFGGIRGAGLAAKYYNERLYEGYADKIMKRENYFPMMMLRYTF